MGHIMSSDAASGTGSTRRRSAWRASAWLNLALAFAIMFGVAALAPWPVRVVDGDTVDRWPWRHRLVGFDAPETRRPRCAAEREAGLAAAQRLRDLIAGAARVELVRTTWRLDRYGRVLSRLEIDGRDVAAIAIAEGWGHAYNGRGPRGGWCGE